VDDGRVSGCDCATRQCRGKQIAPNRIAWKLGIKFEYTACDTPQQNHLAKLAFATTIDKAWALMAAANIPIETRYKLWKMAIKTTMDLDGLLLWTIGGITKTKYKHAYGLNSKFATHLRTWGEAGTVKTKVTGTPKLSNHGAVCLFIGMLRTMKVIITTCGAP
jgi:hypothetical protein